MRVLMEPIYWHYTRSKPPKKFGNTPTIQVNKINESLWRYTF